MPTENDLRSMLRRLADLEPRLEVGGAGTTFGTWVASRQTKPGVWTMPYVEYGELEREFRAAAAGWVRADIDWRTWGETDDALALRRDPARLTRATPEELAHLLTTIVRGDRFNEGLLLDAFESGLLARICHRAAGLVGSTG